VEIVPRGGLGVGGVKLFVATLMGFVLVIGLLSDNSNVACR